MAERRRPKRAATRRPKGEKAAIATRRHPASGKAAGKKPAVKASRRPATKPVRGRVKAVRGGKVGVLATAPPPARVRELDPRRLCGAGTSVTQLYRVDDLPTGTVSVHLVFFDRHGWYCEHGRECPAVTVVRRHTKQTISTRQAWTGR